MRNVLIYGRGLAGSWMAYELHKRGLNVNIVDDGATDTSSRIAAGLINQVNGSRPILGWNSEVILPHAWKAYAELEQFLGVKVWTDRRIRRVFLTEKDALLWQNAVDRGLHVEWSPLPNILADGVRADFGGVEYAGATIETNLLIDTLSQTINHQPSTTNHEPPTIDDFDLVIWCTGWKASQHPLWSWLPFQPVKGEILDAEVEGAIDAVYLRGVWIIPTFVEEQRVASSEYPGTLDAGRRTSIRIGSTHDWDDLTSTPTEQAKHVLMEKATEILGREIHVVGQRAAVRPAAQSKRPYIGIHPEHPKHAIVNGLGAKGSMWAPWAAQHLAEHVLHGAPLDEEVNVLRWWRK